MNKKGKKIRKKITNIKFTVVKVNFYIKNKMNSINPKIVYMFFLSYCWKSLEIIVVLYINDDINDGFLRESIPGVQKQYLYSQSKISWHFSRIKYHHNVKYLK